jgi:tungstate transport system substrate-binding protein
MFNKATFLSGCYFLFPKIKRRVVLMKKMLTYSLLLLLIISLMSGCAPKTEAPAETPAETPAPDPSETPVPKEVGSIILATTTSTQDSGLLDFLLPIFTEKTGIQVKTVAVGTGNALQMGRDGEADVLLVHAKADELKLVEEGHGTVRHDVMYNDFVLVGPNGGAVTYGSDIKAAMMQISEEALPFISRGDDSGTHKKELGLWKAVGMEPAGEWYIEAGAGMGDVLKIADEKKGYTLSDRATYLAMKDTLELDIVIEGDNGLFNQYGVIPVNADKGEMINVEGALIFMNWIISEEGQNLISRFGVDKYGEPLFIPNFGK